MTLRRASGQGYQVIFDKDAEEDLAALSPDVRERVVARTAALAETPKPASSKELKGRLRGIRSLRIGDWRASYTIDEKSREVWVWSVGHRRDFYQRLARRR